MSSDKRISKAGRRRNRGPSQIRTLGDKSVWLGFDVGNLSEVFSSGVRSGIYRAR